MEETPQATKAKKYRRDKPWDNDPSLDKWKIEEFKPSDNPHGMFEESAFSILFPEYREKYIKEIWPLVLKELAKFHIKCELNLLEGSMSVRTTRKTWDPYIIIKARDMIKLIARSVGIEQAKTILQDDISCDIIKLKGMINAKDRFIKRRDRLLGPKGMTLRAIQILTKCYILIQGNTVSAIGNFKQLKIVRKLVLDTMKNIHPIYNIKELMIRRELANNPNMENENWDRFLPHFKKQKQNKKLEKKRMKQNKMREKANNKKEYSVFPPEQLPRKEDLMIESGEYFLSQKQRQIVAQNKKKEQQRVKTMQKKRVREGEGGQISGKKRMTKEKESSVDELKHKFNIRSGKKLKISSNI